MLKARVVLENKNLKLMPGLSADLSSSTKRTYQDKHLRLPNKSDSIQQQQRIYGSAKMIVGWKPEESPIASNEELTYIQEEAGAGRKVIGSNALLLFEGQQAGLAKKLVQGIVTFSLQRIPRWSFLLQWCCCLECRKHARRFPDG